MIKLSKRLQTIASYIRSDAKVIDIGCDHAHLDIYLKERYPHLKIMAVDNKKGALDIAASNIATHNMTNLIDLRLSDGLSDVDKTEIDTIVIAGMGTSNIIDILDKDKLDNVSDMIIQTNNDYYQLRKAICKLGYYIADEQIVKESKIYYIIIYFKKGNKKYHNDDYLFGPILRRNRGSLYKELMSKDLKKKEILLLQIPQKNFLRRQRLKIDILKLMKEIR